MNNGTLDLQSDNNSICNATFSKSFGNQTVSGTGATTRFAGITVNIGNLQSNTLEITTPSFSTFNPAAAFLTLTNGTFKLSAPGTVTAFGATTTLSSFTKLWINHAGATVSTTGGNIDFAGNITVSAGTLNIGNAANNSLLSRGGTLFVNGGTLNIAGMYDRATTTSTSRFNITAGTLNVPTVGSTNTTRAPFMISVPGSSFVQNGGTIVILREGGTGAQNLGFNCAGGNIYSVTGGTLQIGNATTPVAQTMLINSVAPVGSLVVFNTNAPVASLSTNALTVINDVTIMGGTLLANNLNITVGRNWSNTGGTYTPGTNTTNFTGTVAQLISKTTPPETFNNLFFASVGVKSLGSNINCRNVTIGSGATLSAGAGSFTINTIGNWSNAGTYNGQANGLVNCNGTVAQTIGGAAVTNFRHLTIANAAGASITSAQNLLGTLTLTNGMFTTTGQTFTLVSDAAGTARIATITGGDITGNITMQRYLGGSMTGWRLLGSAIASGTTLADWSDDFVMSGFPGSQYPSFPFISVYTYDETVAGVKENGYVAATNISNPLTTRTGFFCYVGPTPITVDVSGPPGKFNQNYTLAYTSTAGPNEDGWNLVANPYPSTIDWDAGGWSRTNLAGYVQVWNPGN
ncbi:MAG: CHU large protein, partial [Bacteroidetes bacterium]